jgi:hypothetical protein
MVGQSLLGTNLLLGWDGGQRPHQVQMATNLVNPADLVMG